MIISLSGAGKGKTTAAIGGAVRAIANGHSVLLLRFLKNGVASELDLLSEFCDFYHESFDDAVIEKPTVPNLIKNTRKLINKIYSQSAEVVILDEILICLDRGYISQEELLQILNYLEELDCVTYLTGRITRKELRNWIWQVSDIGSNVFCETHCYNSYCETCDQDFNYTFKYCPNCGRELVQSSPKKKGIDF